MKIWYICISAGGAETLFRGGGKIKKPLIAKFISNVCAKHWESRMFALVTPKNVGILVILFRDAVYNNIVSATNKCITVRRCQ